MAAKSFQGALAAGCAMLLALSAPAAAQSFDAGIHGGTIELPRNKSQVITSDRPIARAMIGNPEVADIVPLTNQSIYLLGKSMGTTSLTLYDDRGRVLSVMDIAVGPDVDAFRTQIAQLVPDADIDAHISGESMVLTGIANSPAAVDRAMQLARTYAGNNIVNMIGLGSSQQVMLEVRFAEVRRSVGDDVAVRGFGTGSDVRSVFGPGSTLTPNPLDGTALLQAGSVLDTFGIIGTSFRALGLDIEAYLNALEQRGFAKTLAEPTLVALSGETADFLAGGEFPIPVVQDGGNADDNSYGRVTVEFKQFGVSLGFTPTVLGDNTINLVVTPEVSQIDPAASIQLNGLTIPGLQTRRASTTLELRDGESFAIAGLLQEDIQTTVNQMPLLGNIPILGALFRSTEFQRGETELLIVVTPRLVQPIRPDQVRLPTDRVADPDPAALNVFGDGYDPLPAEVLADPSTQNSGEVSDYEY